ncbi:hypothetical protein FGG08_006324 [Glutinoglossum americanum]|uniref:Heterokaryon incompatibility domain-containing protein n=1 Tax=Glutinoglossum americanum TaxID=1670608 RepID=A0A9P8HSU3_9PEZI|nr:hypothetical protein FGG08_006324 [Glutinoglossum americanum]
MNSGPLWPPRNPGKSRRWFPSSPCLHSAQLRRALLYAKHPLPGLSSRSIRVFDLQPSRTGLEGEIHGDLRVVSLDKDPPYEALSYAWSEGWLSHHIVCDGLELPVTASCYNALLRLRRRNRLITLWVDSICINQSDDGEKSGQVKLMRRIYWKAEKVDIWLGPGNKDSDYAFDWLQSATLGKHTLLGMRFRNFPGNMMPGEALRALRMLPELTSVALRRLGFRNSQPDYKHEAMRDLIDRDWFKRMWTMQELVMAREPVIICGEKIVRWNNLLWGIIAASEFADNMNSIGFSTVFNSVLAAESLWLDLYIKAEWNEAQVMRWLSGYTELFPTLERVANFMQTHGHIIKSGQILMILLVILIRFHRGLRPLDSMWLLLLSLCCAVTMVLIPTQTQWDWEGQARSKIVGVLHMIRTRQATMKVDKVFALYGMLQELGINLDEPDYRKPVDQVYMNFTRTIINWHRSLDILVEASLPGLPNAPSWVPNWSEHYYRVTSSPLKAASISSSRFSFSSCGRKLETFSKLVDKIEFCAEPLQEQGDDPFAIDTAPPQLALLSCFVRNVGALRQWMTYVLQLQPDRTLDSISQDLLDVTHSETGLEGEDRYKSHQVFKRWFVVLTADYSSYFSLCSPDLSCALTLLTNESLSRYHRERCRAIAGKRTFFTTSGGRIGTGPLSVQVGDTVAILSGLHVPMVLRRVGSDYQVVGLAYIPGMVLGEGCPGDDADFQALTLV